MAYKPIHYGDHAAENLTKRRITRDEVKWLLARGTRSKAEVRGREQRWKAEGKVGKRDLRVVFIERKGGIEIITAMVIT